MKASEGPFRSPLDKPLKELTEEDISQLTREDCRRYLKEKGMRRPSWNKSQAIQQVLSLKALFDSWPGKEETGSRKSQPAASGSVCPAESAGEEPVNLSEGSPSGSGADEGRSVPPDLESPVAASEPTTIRLPVFCPRGEAVGVARSGGAGDTELLQASGEPAGDFPMSISRDSVSQMTIFYGGKVDVYDDVPAEKARAIMLLAASPNFMPQVADSRSFAFTARRARPPSPPLPPQGPAPPPPSSSPSPTDGPKTRKESVQRFLEKRKDRGRLKPVWGRSKSSSPMELYFSHHMRESARNVRTSSGDRCSPTNPIPRPTPARSGTRQPISTGNPNEDGNAPTPHKQLVFPPVFNGSILWVQRLFVGLSCLQLHVFRPTVHLTGRYDPNLGTVFLLLILPPTPNSVVGERYRLLFLFILERVSESSTNPAKPISGYQIQVLQPSFISNIGVSFSTVQYLDQHCYPFGPAGTLTAFRALTWVGCPCPGLGTPESPSSNIGHSS